MSTLNNDIKTALGRVEWFNPSELYCEATAAQYKIVGFVKKACQHESTPEERKLLAISNKRIRAITDSEWTKLRTYVRNWEHKLRVSRISSQIHDPRSVKNAAIEAIDAELKLRYPPEKYKKLLENELEVSIIYLHLSLIYL